MPFLPDTPVTTFTDLTPHQIWLAVLAVCTVSYVSYLLQRYVAPREGGLWAAVLGGLYSSTATTVVLARRARAVPALAPQAVVGIILATAIMYLRILIVVAVFNRALALALAPTFGALATAGLIFAGLRHWLSRAPAGAASANDAPVNPLELSAALIFAVLFVIVSLATAWARVRFGAAGLYALAGIIGFSDIDPFVLSVASGEVPPPAAVTAILIAASSNNLLKAVYAAAFAGFRTAIPAAAALAALAFGGLAAAWW